MSYLIIEVVKFYQAGPPHLTCSLKLQTVNEVHPFFV